MKSEKEYDGWVSSIELANGKRYGLKCAVVEAYPMTCKKCGAPMILKQGDGICEYCGTRYTTKLFLEEADRE